MKYNVKRQRGELTQVQQTVMNECLESKFWLKGLTPKTSKTQKHEKIDINRSVNIKC